MSLQLETARECWGEDLPDWVEALARECAATSQNQVAKRLERSSTLISQVLRAKYPGDLRAVEDLVRGHLMAETVACPSLGALPLHECRSWMAKAHQFQNTNSLRVRMYRACRTCTRYQGAMLASRPRHPAANTEE